MRTLSPSGQQAINELAQRHGFSQAAVLNMLEAVINGRGSMAQFNHAEFGGSGQWMRGGMTMLSEMFNYALKGRVEGLCHDLASLVASQPDLLQGGSFQSQSQDGGYGQQQNQCTGQSPGSFSDGQPYGSGSASPVSLFVPPAPGQGSDWWGADLRWPTSTCAQNGVRYAYFAQARRLAIEVGGRVSLYDTLDHQIGGFSQQQGVGGSLTFSSQYGLVEVARLPLLTVDGVPPQQAPLCAGLPTVPSEPCAVPVPVGESDVFALIERLAGLHAKGILSAEEFAAKKTELLSRI